MSTWIMSRPSPLPSQRGRGWGWGPRGEGGRLTEFANGAGRKRVPLWHRIEGVLRHKIAIGEYQPGAALPSEPELAASFGVSRMTVREAVRGLTSQGLVRQIQGKGTFVLRGPAPTGREAIVTGLVGEAQLNSAFPALSPDPSHQSPRCSHIDLATVAVPPRVAELLRLTDPTVVRAERITVGPYGSFAYVLDYLPHAIGDRITPEHLAEAWLTQVLPDRLGIVVLEAHELIEATLADVILSEKLDVPFGSPLLYAERVYFGAGGQPLYVANIWRRADRFRYAVTFRFHGGDDAANHQGGGENLASGAT